MQKFKNFKRSFSFQKSQSPPQSLFNDRCEGNKFEEAIDVLCQENRLKEAIELLHQIHRPSPRIYSTLIAACVRHRALQEGKMVHAHTKASKFVPGISISNRLLDLYSKCGSLGDAQKVFDEMIHRDLCSWNTMIAGYAKIGRLQQARKLFDEMPQRDNFSWNAVISGYVSHGRPWEAMELFRRMQNHESSNLNKFTLSSALAASAAIPCLRLGKEIHGYLTRTGLDSDEVVWSALLDLYGKCGSLNEARGIFYKMANKDVVSWTTMIHRCFEDGRKEEGFSLFRELMGSGIRPNEYTFAGVLNVCAGHAAEHLGKEVHGYMVRIGYDPCSYAVSALVHLYSKCGNTENARRVFNQMPRPDLVSWTSLIAGYAQNGQPDEALRFFELLLRSGTKPDQVVFVGVLSACTHAGLVDKGLEYFHSIKEKHGLMHTADHYACVIDLLARAGRFKEAEDIIDKMPIKPDKFLWAALLGGCRIHGNLELAERAANALFEIEPENPATYITLANIYANAVLWTEEAKVRKAMESRGIVKKPGKSWIEIKRQVHVFLVGHTSHPKICDIHAFLGEISKKMKEEGYIPDTNFVLHDVEEEQKEQNLVYHSEKLAVAFGIISTPPGTPIKLEARKFNVSGCKKLRTLDAEFAWNYSNLTTTNNSTNTTTINGTLIEIYFRAKLRNYEGWVAWGVNPGKKPQMVGTKAIIAIKHNKGTTHADTYEVTKETRKGCRLWPTPRAEFGLNVLDIQAWSNNTRKCTTLYAKLILPFPEYNITRLNHVWQVGDDVNGDQPLQHRVTLQNVDSTETINITSPDGQSYGQNRSLLRSVHGVLNIIGWGTLLPIGVIIARYFRVFPFSWNKVWFNIHVGFQLTGFLIGTAGWAIGLSLGRSSKYYTFHTHRTFGILIFTFSTIQMLAFRLKPKLTDDYRKYWNMYHHFLGYGLLAIIVINIFKGISMLKGGVGWKWAYIGIIALLGAITLTFEIVTWLRFMLNGSAISIPPPKDKTNNNNNNPTQNK